jgi:hypothetical protein
MNIDTESIQKQIHEKAALLSSNRLAHKKAQAALEGTLYDIDHNMSRFTQATRRQKVT